MENKLEKIIYHAYKTVPYYKKKYTQELAKQNDTLLSGLENLPVITKEELVLNERDILSEEYISRVGMERIDIVRTSGSTGKFLKVFWANSDYIRSMTELWYFRKKFYGIKPSDKYCYFFTTDYISNTFVNKQNKYFEENSRSLGICKNIICRKNMRDICQKIYEFNPTYMLLQPSIAVLLANTFNEEQIPIPSKLQYIELTGEFLVTETRKIIEKIFKCRISNQYGCIETNSIAFECPEGKLHINSSNVVVEVLNEDKKDSVGDLYITSLTNYTMPFIRYKIGDRGRICYEKCKCGNRNPILQLQAGRIADYAITQCNEKIPAYIFLLPIEYINGKWGNIIQQFQIRQKMINKFEIKIGVKEEYVGWKEMILEEYLENLSNEEIKKAYWTIEITPHFLPESKNGKLAFFYNELEIRNE